MSQQSPPTLTDMARRIARHLLDPLAAALYRWGVHPDSITLAGLLIVAIAAFFIADGQFSLAAVLLVLGLPLDALDGAVARQMQRQGRFGAVLDSTLDRYADGFIFGALSYYFALHDHLLLMMLALAALLGSLLVSYVRARAEGVAVDVKIGLFTRLERLLVVLVMLFIPALMEIGLWVLALGTHGTAIQRLWYVRQALPESNNHADASGESAPLT